MKIAKQAIRYYDNVDIIIGATTDIISAEGKIVSAGGIDTHVHLLTSTIASCIRKWYHNTYRWRYRRV